MCFKGLFCKCLNKLNFRSKIEILSDFLKIDFHSVKKNVGCK